MPSSKKKSKRQLEAERVAAEKESEAAAAAAAAVAALAAGKGELSVTTTNARTMLLLAESMEANLRGKACRTIAQYAEMASSNRDELHSLGAASVLSRLAHDKNTSTDLMRNVLFAFSELCAHAEARRQMRDLDMIRCLLQLVAVDPVPLDPHTEESDILMYACVTLEQLTCDAGLVADLVDAGAVQALLRLVACEPLNEEIRVLATSTLAFCLKDLSCRQTFCRDGGPTIIVKLLGSDQVEPTASSAAITSTTPKSSRLRSRRSSTDQKPVVAPSPDAPVNTPPSIVQLHLRAELLKCVGEAAVDAPIRSALLELGCVALLLYHGADDTSAIDNSLVHFLAYSALATLLCDTRTLPHLVKADGARRLVQRLRIPMYPLAQRGVALAVARGAAAGDDDTFCLLFNDAQGVEPLVDLLYTANDMFNEHRQCDHENEAAHAHATALRNVLATVALALGALAQHHKSALATSIGRAQGVEALVALLERAREPLALATLDDYDANELQMALYALSEVTAIVENRQRALACEGIEVLLSVFTHLNGCLSGNATATDGDDDAAVVRATCLAHAASLLHNLAQDARFRDELWANDQTVASLAGHLAHIHAAHPHVQSRLLHALAALAVDSRWHARLMPGHATSDAPFSTVPQLLASDSLEVRTAAAYLVEQLCVDASSARQLCECGALEQLMRLTQSRRPHTQPIRYAFTALATLLRWHTVAAYWLDGRVDANHCLPDGFYDMGAYRAVSAQPFMSLAKLQARPVSHRRAVLLVDMQADMALASLVGEANERLANVSRDDVRSAVAVLAELVVRHCSATDTWELHTSDIKSQLHSNVIPIGTLRTGTYFHRALLFKALADRLDQPIACSLVRADYARAWNTLAFPDAPEEVLVDLMHCPGRLLPLHHPLAAEYTRP